MNQKVADDRGIKLVFLKICTHQFGDLTPRRPFFSMDQFVVYKNIFSFNLGFYPIINHKKNVDDMGVNLVFLKVCTRQFGDLTPRRPCFSMDQCIV